MDQDDAALHAKLSLDKRAMVAVWFLATKETFRQLSQRFGVSTSTAHKCVFDTVDALVKHLPDVIKFPTDFANEANKFYKFKYPNVCGAIDGTSIDIKPPALQKADYFTRKSTTSINLTAVCDASMKFTSIFCGYSGRCHDAFIFQMSPLYRRIFNENAIPEQFHLLGDAAYGLHVNIMTPYPVPSNEALTLRQNIHNNRHSSTRMVIERAFGNLKGRWRRLKGLECNIGNASSIISACAVLHNICLDSGDDYDADLDAFLQNPVDDEYVCDIDLPTMDAKEKRRAITELIYQ